jgi:hypothetical protein
MKNGGVVLFPRRWVAMLFFAALSVAIASAQTYKTLYQFAGTGLGNPNGVIIDRAGNLYGLAYGSGACSGVSSACGVVFELSQDAGGTWNRTVIHTFGGADGTQPGALILDANGNLFGECTFGGTYNAGTVFELTHTTGGWTEQILYNFTGGSDGANPYWTLALDNFGNVYGIASGGVYSQGLVFELSPLSSSSWQQSVIYSFDAVEGTGPSPSIAVDSSGNLYGEANVGYHDNYHSGTIYKLSPGSGGAWTASVIYAFQGTKHSTVTVTNGLAIDGGGNLYGVAGSNSWQGSSAGAFELESPAYTNTLTVWEFAESLRGGELDSVSTPLLTDSLGNVYGGVYNAGTNLVHHPYDGYVFRVGPSGTASYLFPSLPLAQRYYPVGSLAVDGQGNVYGATTSINYEGVGTPGTIFEITF